MSNKAIIQVKNLTKHFPVKKTKLFEPRSFVHAVNDVSFDIYEGETLGLVGESGSGKSTLGRTMINLYPATAGEVIYKEQNILELSDKKMKPLRKELQIIFQDPYSSLNPRLNVFSIIGEAMVEHKIAKKGKDLEDKVQEIMEICGLSAYHMYRYPHQFSGGQRQRIGIARALALNPKFVVCDEPVSALTCPYNPRF